MRAQVRDPSLLRFLVDMRDADLDDKQLRDDLMTMLIAGHETTAAVRLLLHSLPQGVVEMYVNGEQHAWTALGAASCTAAACSVLTDGSHTWRFCKQSCQHATGN